MSLSFYATSYLFDNIHKFDCLRPDKNLDLDICNDIPKKNYDKPQSLMFFFKQMDCKEEFEFFYEKEDFVDNEPVQYMIEDPFSEKMPDFKSWPLSKEVYRM
jgi:hypothetical protein